MCGCCSLPCRAGEPREPPAGRVPPRHAGHGAGPAGAREVGAGEGLCGGLRPAAALVLGASTRKSERSPELPHRSVLAAPGQPIHPCRMSSLPACLPACVPSMTCSVAEAAASLQTHVERLFLLALLRGAGGLAAEAEGGRGRRGLRGARLPGHAVFAGLGGELAGVVLRASAAIASRGPRKGGLPKGVPIHSSLAPRRTLLLPMEPAGQAAGAGAGSRLLRPRLPPRAGAGGGAGG